MNNSTNNKLILILLALIVIIIMLVITDTREKPMQGTAAEAAETAVTSGFVPCAWVRGGLEKAPRRKQALRPCVCICHIIIDKNF